MKRYVALLIPAVIACLFLIPGFARAVTTLTGTSGTVVNASCSAPSAGDFITGASIQTPLQSVENDLATISRGVWTSTAAESVGSAGYIRFLGRMISRPPAAAPHSGTAHTASFVDLATANEFRYDGAATAPNDNYLKIREGTSTAPGGLYIGDWIRFVTGPQASAGHLYTIFREDGATKLAELWGPGQWVEFVWDGSQWRYVSSSPWVPNGTAIPANPNYYGDGSLGTTGVVLYTANL